MFLKKRFLLPTLALFASSGLAAEAESKPAKPATSAEQKTAQKAKPQADELPELVVTATRTAQDPMKVPSIVRTLDAGTMAEREVRTFPEALRETPGVAIQKTSNGQGSPYIRGFTGFRNLLLIDGIRFNNPTFRDGPNQYWNTIDQQALQRVEVIPSQGSVMYGSDAVGGTVNAFTKDSGFLSEAEGGFFTHGLASYRWSSAEHSNVEHLEANIGQGQRWGLHVGATLSQFGDVTAPRVGRQRNTGYDQWAYDVRFDMALDANWTFTAVHQQLAQDDVWRTHATLYGVPFEGTAVGTDRERLFDQERSLSYVRLAGKDLQGPINSASLTVSLQTANEDQRRITGGGAFSLNSVRLTTLGVDLQLASETPIGHLVYGIDYFHDFIESEATDNLFQGAVADDSNYDLVGVYLEDEITLGDRLHVFLGGRYTHVRADLGKFRDPVTLTRRSYSDEWDNFSASARFVVDLDAQDRYALFGGVSQSFRAPNLSDLSRSDVALSGQVEVPSPGLSPEKYLTYEIGVKAQTESVTASFSYFYTAIEDMITRKPTGIAN